LDIVKNKNTNILAKSENSEKGRRRKRRRRKDE
jgi:hypothetical protein